MASLFASCAHAQSSTWWHGRYIPSSSTLACEFDDALIAYEAKTVRPFRTNCDIVNQVDLRDMQGVLLDIRCSYEDSPDEGYNDRNALLELSNGNVLSYSRLQKTYVELRRCAAPSAGK
jgi:hypothetical protein